MADIDATMYVASDGATWQETHWIEAADLDSPLPKFRVVEIRDGTGEPRPFVVYIVPNVRP